MVRKVFWEVGKQLRLIFRSWTSLSLLVLAPLLLILLLGFAFSANELYGVRIGIVGQADALSAEFERNVSATAGLVRFSSAQECIESLRRESVHLCLVIEGSLPGRSSDPPEDTETMVNASRVTFYYDNTARGVAEKVIVKVREFFGVQTEEFSIATTRGIFEDVASMVVYLRDRGSELQDLRNESFGLRARLMDRGERLRAVYGAFRPRYERVKELQQEFNAAADSLFYGSQKLNESIVRMERDMDVWRSQVQMYLALGEGSAYVLMKDGEAVLFDELADTAQYGMDLSGVDLISLNQTVFFSGAFGNYSVTPLSMSLLDNVSVVEMNGSVLLFGNLVDSGREVMLNLSTVNPGARVGILLAVIDASFDAARVSAREFHETAVFVDGRAWELRAEVDRVVWEIDAINIILEDEIRLNDEAIEGIDQSVRRIDEIYGSLERGIEGLSKLDPEFAERIIRPLLQDFSVLLPQVRGIQVLFPILLVAIVIFSSLLFATVVTYTEIHSMAAMRNRIAPVSGMVWFFGLLITNVLVVMFQVCVLLLVAQFRFGLPIAKVWMPLVFVALILACMFVLLGMLIATLCASQQTAVLVGTFAALAFFLFSTVVSPLEAMPPLAGMVASFSPMVMGASIVRGVLLLGLGISAFSAQLVMLGVYTLVLLLVASLLFERNHRR